MTNPTPGGGGRRSTITEPTKRGSLVRDKDGDHWRRGTTRWTCLARVDGVRVRAVARLRWRDLVGMYGPLELINEGVPL